MSHSELPFVDEMFDKGIMKPDIVFFGESLPEEFFDCVEKDVHECDLVLVLGTSLKVAPVSHIIEMVDPSVPQILINREVVAQPHQFDAELLGNCDNVVAALAGLLDWRLDAQATVSPEQLDKSFTQSPTRPFRFLFQGALPHDESDESEDEQEEQGMEEEGQGEGAGEEEEEEEEGGQEEQGREDVQQHEHEAEDREAESLKRPGSATGSPPSATKKPKAAQERS
jgi:hypothetical protein